jgi:hypothetical protein
LFLWPGNGVFRNSCRIGCRSWSCADKARICHIFVAKLDVISSATRAYVDCGDVCSSTPSIRFELRIPFAATETGIALSKTSWRRGQEELGCSVVGHDHDSSRWNRHEVGLATMLGHGRTNHCRSLLQRPHSLARMLGHGRNPFALGCACIALALAQQVLPPYSHPQKPAPIHSAAAAGQHDAESVPTA